MIKLKYKEHTVIAVWVKPGQHKKQRNFFGPLSKKYPFIKIQRHYIKKNSYFLFDSKVFKNINIFCLISQQSIIWDYFFEKKYIILPRVPQYSLYETRHSPLKFFIFYMNISNIPLPNNVSICL